MKWQYVVGTCALCALALAVAFVFRGNETEAQEARQAVYSQQAAAPQYAAPVVKPASEPKLKASKEQTAAELVAIIQETESPDTFLVSLMSLIALDPKDISILPIAIRKAEKLDLLKGIFNGGQLRPGQEMLMEILEIMIGDKLEHLMNPKEGTRFRAEPAPCCAVGALCPSPTFATPETVVGGPVSAVYSAQPPVPVTPIAPNTLRRVMPPPQPVAPQSN